MTGRFILQNAVATTLGIAVLLPALAWGEPFTRPAPKEGFSYPECYCTNRGERVEIGGFSCLTVGDDRFLAQCDLSLNSPIWRKVEDSCPTAAVEEGDEEPAG